MIKLTGKGFNIDAVARKLATQRQAIKNDAGRMAVNHFKGSFRDQGFTDESTSPWKARKKDPKGKKRGILVNRAILLRNIRVLGTPGDRVIMGTRGIKYARIHNEGLQGKAFGHTFRMPKRQFIGNSRKLEREIFKRVQNRINRAWA